MALKPQDILVMLKLLTLRQKPWSYALLAVQLGMSPSQLHSAVQRALAAQLAVRKNDKISPNTRNLREFIVHGVRYAFVAERGEMTRGMPTGHAAPPLNRHFAPGDEPPPVWPDAEGTMRGFAFTPLYHVVPQAARSDTQLYELLVLVDGIRGGGVREREIATRELVERLKSHAQV
jgi:hypothetical protein